MSKTNDHAKAHRAYHDYVRLGSPDRRVLQALSERLERYEIAKLAAQITQALKARNATVAAIRALAA